MNRFSSRGKRECDLDDEIRVHLQMAVDERVARGESRADAERAARQEFGDVRRVKEETRAMWGRGPLRLPWGLGTTSLALAGPALGDWASYGSHASANDRLKDSFRSRFWAAMILAALLHLGAFALWPTLAARDLSISTREIEVIPVPVVDIPPPPQPIAHPAKPVIASVDVPDDATIGSTDFLDNPVATLPAPPREEHHDLSAGPTITPYTVAPSVLNRDEVVRAMEREYPTMLRDARIGGTVTVFFFIDETGRVQDRRIDASSGYAGLDAAALAVAETFRFSPALNRDKRVPVWVSLPITFRVR